MPTNREIALYFSLRDQATATFNRFKAQVEAGATKLQSTFTKLGPIIAGAFSVVALRNFINLSNVQEQASAKLAQALKTQGVTSDSVRKSMEDYSSALQRVTVYGDEQITSLQALLVSMTHLHGNALQPLVQATLDLATGMNMDVEAAALLIGKTIGGQDALGRYGISIKGAKTESEKLARIIDEVQKRFGGMAVAAGETGAGKLKQLQNAVHDLEERFGFLLKDALVPLLPTIRSFTEGMQKLPPPILSATLVVGGLTAAILALNAALLTNPITLTLLGITAGVVAVSVAVNQTSKDVGKATGELRIMREELIKGEKAYEDFNNSGVVPTFQSNFRATAAEVKNVIASYKALGGIWQDKAPATVLHLTLAETKQKIKDLQKELDDLIPGSDLYIKKLAEIERQTKALKDATEAAEIAVKVMILGARTALSEIGGFKLDIIPEAYLKERSDAIKKAAAELHDKLAALMGGPTISPDELAARHKAALDLINRTSIMSLNDEKARELAITDEWEKKAIDTVTRDSMLGTLEKEREITRIHKIAVDERMKTEIEAFRRTFSEISGFAGQAMGLITQLVDQNSQARLDAIETERDAQLQAIDDQLNGERLTVTQKKALETQRAAIQKKYDDEERKEKLSAWVGEKEANIATSVINTAQAVVKTLSDWGVPAGIPFAAIAAALGLAQTAIIASQSPPKFHQGVEAAYISGPPGRDVPIIVQTGETVTVKTAAQRARESRPVQVIQYHQHFAGAITTKEAFKQVVEEGMKELGVTDVNKFFRNNGHGIHFET
jgi:hypothetical protein